MRLTLTTKIWLTLLSIVLMFTFFTLYYFPAQQGKLLLKNYNNEVQNLANTVALGVRIAIKEQNFEGVQTAMEFVKDDPRLLFVSMLQNDTVWNEAHTSYKNKVSVFKTFPENQHPNVKDTSSETVIIKYSPFVTSVMSGSIMLAYTTKAIMESQRKIRLTSLFVSALVLTIGILLGLWLAKNILVPVMQLRDAAKSVGMGDLSQKIKKTGKDEIGQLGKAFNKMIEDLSITRKELNETNGSLTLANSTLNKTLSELKTTQTQLIQSEKMASLGELTAGIAHEIQNPLNFVNNFSEVNAELIEEMKAELKSGNIDEAISISNHIGENEKKISNHGKRADAIVKGMLQHSKGSKGIKEQTNLNGLVQEYLRLSFHGLRAKDKSFTAITQTDFDKSIGEINVIAQDIGRVLLNLFTNSFYSVAAKKKQLGDAYKPVVNVSTKRLSSPLGDSDKVEIRVKDNGLGISQKNLNKVFQPFFTTKPSGEGTGLGLSLSYDIITKGHGGEMKVETREGQGAEFIIQLPV